MKKSEFLLGNEAIALGALEAGIRFASSYPGTPASEILESFKELSKKYNIRAISKWMVNEKVAFECALGASWCGMNSMVSMKQVGLNVAADALMSAAYIGTRGAFVIVSVDDPGPHSSQTEQDSRFLAMFAKVPVFDPSSPQDAKKLIKKATKISIKYSLPVMLRPVLRVSHSRSNVPIEDWEIVSENYGFTKEPERLAATPKFRYILHKELNEKIRIIAKENAINLIKCAEEIEGKEIFITCGIFWALMKDLKVPNVLKVDMPYPIDKDFFNYVTERFDSIWVLEETYPVVELQFFDRKKVKGRLSGDIPLEGEVDINTLEEIVTGTKRTIAIPRNDKKPRLCPGCGHRATFYAIRKTFPNGVYPGDIGCYTLGVNLKAVDTCLCMGASISNAIGISKVLNKEKIKTPVIAVIGDSTFIHAGIPALIEAVDSNAPIVVVVLDNRTTAMTGGQPVVEINFEDLALACKVEKVEKTHGYNLTDIINKLKNLWKYTSENIKPSLLIVESPCVIYGEKPEKRIIPKIKEEACSNCKICYEVFECPAIVERKNKATINSELCTGCLVCLEVCPQRAITT